MAQGDTAQGEPGGQLAAMRTAIGQAVALGPEFLAGRVDADRMAHAMINAAGPWAHQPHGSAGDGDAHMLHHALAELMTCGSGYLAGRCDAACVARTMTEMVRAFPPR